MTFQYASDLHLEFPENRDYLEAHPIEPVAELLILAGDIMPFSEMENHQDFFDELANKFKKTYWVAGNHEYYGDDVLKDSGSVNKQIRDSIFLINNASIVAEGVRFLFSTLWTEIHPQNQWRVQRQLNDFAHINYGGETFKPYQYNRLHYENLDFLKQALTESTSNNTVVVTHHVPTFYKYPEKYKNDPINEAFAVELFDLIVAAEPDYWIYGHHHSNCPNFTIGKTEMCTNQLGYVAYNEHFGFDPKKTIVLS